MMVSTFFYSLIFSIRMGEGFPLFFSFFFALLFFIYEEHNYLMRKINRKYLVWCDVTFDPLSRPRWSNVGMLRIILPSAVFNFQYKSVKIYMNIVKIF